MELSRELFECGVYPLGDILRDLGLGEWEAVIQEEGSGGIPSMAESSTENKEAIGSGYLILPEDGDSDPVSMGDSESLVAWMENIRDGMRASLQDQINPLPDSQVKTDAQNTFYRCLDQFNGFLKRNDRGR